jgi:hypothetical protein
MLAPEAAAVGSLSGKRDPSGRPVTEYKISSFCSAGGCVEVGRAPEGSVVVRDSKDPERLTSLVFTAQEWRAFVAGVKNGEFDLA